MGRQWLQKNREINAARRGKLFNRLTREIAVAAKGGAPDPALNPRLAAAVEAARKHSVPNDTIQRAIQKGAGLLGEKLEIELVTFEGYAPRHVPVIVECLTDNRNRTAPEMRVLFKAGQLGAKVGFLFQPLGVVEATREGAGLDLVAAAIQAGAQDVEPLEEVPEGSTGGRFFTDRADLDAVARSLARAGWSVTVSEPGYRAKEPLELPPDQRAEVAAFLAALEEHDDVHRVYAALA